jgi:hypothetical protein
LPTRAWGISDAEQDLEYPCDRYVVGADEEWYRGIDVRAPVPVVFRWLCQLRVAPYSYDLIDNFGRRSPRSLTPGLERLAVGQQVMRVFELVEFEHERHLTAQVTRAKAVFGDTAVTYLVRPTADGATRLLVKVVFHYPLPRFARPALRVLLPAADTVMMRRQLVNLKTFAERDSPVIGPPGISDEGAPAGIRR